MRLRITTLVLAAAPLHGVVAAQTPAHVVDSIVRAEALARGVPSVGVVVVVDTLVVVQRAYGFADLSAGRVATAATPFNIASVTKPFTAALVLHLVAEGRVALDDRARRHLPSLPERYRDITVRQLLTHTSGIARDLRTDNFDDPDAATYRARLDSAQASAAPGERFEYSNTGYTVLGWLVSAVEGASLDAVFRRRLWEPLGMRQAGYRGAPADRPVGAVSHDVVGGSARAIDPLTGGFGSGGVSLSVADLAAFGVALNAGRFLPPALRDTAWAPARLADGSPVQTRMFDHEASYGLGWWLATYRGERLLTHGGAIEGYSANLYHFPERRLTIAVVANSKRRGDGAAPVDPLARRIADACLALDSCRPSPELARLGAEITAANRAFSRAYLAGDTARIRSMYLPDALALPSNARGFTDAAAISRLFQSRNAVERVEHALYTERLAPLGPGSLVELGTWFDHWRRVAGGETGASVGRYILTWHRTSEGWRIASDSWVPAGGR
jgi:CubicO group peptidase (beta-lactamase class C family)